ncbi:winged helix-turn-helix transcriptional regulator [bacterium]|nr:winged helix-turn-helix transcriptional regulator [bacterium]
MQETVRAFKALSDSNRIRIIKMLEVRPLCVCEITAVLGLATSTISKHLSILKNAGFIFDQKENRWVNYYLNKTSQFRSVKELLPLLEKWIPDNRIIMQDREKVKIVNREKICGK